DYRRLRDLEQLRGHLLHIIVHDMRAPLAAISGYLDLLKLACGPALSESGRQHLDIALGESASLIEMVSAMLDVSRMEAEQLPLESTPCDLASLARDASRSLAVLHRAARVVVIDPPRPVLA